MYLKDLKNGMIVELRSGDRYVFIKREHPLQNVFINTEGIILGASHYNEDLIHRGHHSFDIMKIFASPKPACQSPKLVWERNPFQKWDIAKHKTKDIVVLVTSADSISAHGIRISENMNHLGDICRVSLNEYEKVSQLQFTNTAGLMSIVRGILKCTSELSDEIPF